MLLRHFIPHEGNVSDALMYYRNKTLYCGMLTLYMLNFINVFVNFVGLSKNAKTKNEIVKICHNLTMQGSSFADSNSVSHNYIFSVKYIMP